MDQKRRNELIAQVSYDIERMCSAEPEAAEALAMTIHHIAGTYSDKYADGEKVIDTKKMLYGDDHGAAINIYQVTRYLQRYITRGHKKSRLIRDLEKAVHYLIIEITRRVRSGDVNQQEPKE